MATRYLLNANVAAAVNGLTAKATPNSTGASNGTSTATMTEPSDGGVSP